MYFYSQSTGGFYVVGVHPVIPGDALPVSDDRHAALLDAQRDGQAIEPDADGVPVAVDPPAPLAAPAIRTLTPLEFRRRLSQSTRAAITLAASARMGTGDATLQTWLDDLSAAQVVDLDDPEVATGVTMLLGVGLITQAEHDALLASPAA